MIGAVFADLVHTKAWHGLLDIAEVAGVLGGFTSVPAGVIEAIRASIEDRAGRYGEIMAYGLMLGGVAGTIVEVTAKLGS